MRASKLRYLLNFYPPFLFCGIHVTRIADDWARITVRLRLRWWNRNYVGTHFGGSLFSMADPMWMLIVMHRLGERYYVWDKAAEIAFIAAAKETVYADFVLEPAVLEELRAAAAGGEKVLRWFEVDVKTAAGTVVAKVRKQLYVRLKPAHRPPAPS